MSKDEKISLITYMLNSFDADTVSAIYNALERMGDKRWKNAMI